MAADRSHYLRLRDNWLSSYSDHAIRYNIKRIHIIHIMNYDIIQTYRVQKNKYILYNINQQKQYFRQVLVFYSHSKVVSIPDRQFNISKIMGVWAMSY